MATLIETLREEHKNIARLLNALEHEIDRLAVATNPDYEILQAIANYFCDYPDRCHHPKEDAIFNQLRAKYPEAAAAVGDLTREHRDAGARARRFRDNIDALFRDAVKRVVRDFGSLHQIALSLSVPKTISGRIDGEVRPEHRSQ